jgi:hypothetical protein
VSHREGPEWLREFQERFTDVLRTPLDRSTNVLRAQTEAYPRASIQLALDGPRSTAEQRLAVYNRQYWFRLFTVLQTAYSVTARLMTYWRFNEFASQFLSANPPRGWDLDRVADGFDRFVAIACAEHPDGALWAEAAALDATWRALMRERESTPFQLASEFPEAAARLPEARLVRSPSVALWFERWPLLEWRAIAHAKGEREPIPPPGELCERRCWALIRERNGIRQVLLEPTEGALLALLSEHTVGDALATIEAQCPADQRAELPAKAQRWLANSVLRGMWSAATLSER